MVVRRKKGRQVAAGLAPAATTASVLEIPVIGIGAARVRHFNELLGHVGLVFREVESGLARTGYEDQVPGNQRKSKG